MDTIFPCDRCGANANPLGTRSINRDGRTLDLCGHHTTEHRPALVKQDWTVVDFPVVLESARELPAAAAVTP